MFENGIGRRLRDSLTAVSHSETLQKELARAAQSLGLLRREDLGALNGTLARLEQAVAALDARVQKLEAQPPPSFVSVTHVADVDREAEDARAYWRDHPLQDYYKVHQPQTDLVIEAIRGLVGDAAAPRVFELGCNVGRNLHFIRQAIPGASVVGIDVNDRAIAEGRQLFGHSADELRVADETSLSKLESKSFDVAFTVSVLDHLPDPRAATADLLRIARHGVVLLELDVGATGRVQGSVEGREIVGYSYSFDYVRILEELGAKVLENRKDSLGPGVLAQYRLLVAR